MVMIIIHIAYITCLVTNDAWHAYDVIGVYKIAIMKLASTVMGEVGAHNQVVRGMPLWPRGQDHW